MKFQPSRMRPFFFLMVLMSTSSTFCIIGQPATKLAIKAIGIKQTHVDCSLYQKELIELFDFLRTYATPTDIISLEKITHALSEQPTMVDAFALKQLILNAIDILTKEPDQTHLYDIAQKVLALCKVTKSYRPSTEYNVPEVDTLSKTDITRGAADQWIVKKTASGNSVIFDPATGTITIDQNLASGASVTFNGVTSTGAALTLDAAASNVINLGATNATGITIGGSNVTGTTSVDGTTLSLGSTTATTVNVGNTNINVATSIIGGSTGTGSARIDALTTNLGNTVATTINMGTTASTDINIGRAGATTLDMLGTTLNVTGTTTAVTGSTSARLDGLTANVGNTTATTVNVGNTNANVATSIIGGSTGTGSASIDALTTNLGNTTATTVNLGTTASTDINIGRAATTTLDILGTALNVTGATTSVTGSTSALVDGPAVNIGTVNNSGNAIVIGKNAATATATTTINGVSIGLGSNSATTTVNLGTGAAVTAIGIGAASTSAITMTGTTIGLTGSTAIRHTGPTELLAGSVLRFYNPAGTYYTSLQAGVITGASLTPLVLPISNATAGQALVNDGSGNLSWGSPLTVNSNKVDAYLATTNQTTAATTETVLFNTAPINPGTAYNTTTGEYTVPTAGDYWINAQVCVQPYDTGTKQIDLVNGGTAQTGYQSYIVVPTLVQSGSPAIYDTRMINLGCLIHLAASDVIRIDYTGTISDIILKNASHLSAYLMST